MTVRSQAPRWVAWASESLPVDLAALHGQIPTYVGTHGTRAARRVLAHGHLTGLERTPLIADRTDVKDSTLITYHNLRRNLGDCLGKEKPLRDLTHDDADSFRLWLVTDQKLADDTVRRRSGIARQFFRVAVRRKLIAGNPFDGLATSVRGNRAKFRFITREEADRIIEACPNAQWRLLFALSRYGGLRCPSEHFALRWSDVDWARSRIQVSSSKTQQHPGAESRVIPLFPELLPFLWKAFEEAEPGAEFVITRYRDAAQNLQTQLQCIIRRAGVEPWPKLFQNLRNTRETELARTWSLHVVTKWIRNSQPVAMKHYLQVTDKDDDRASCVSDRAEKAVQNPVQQGHALRCRHLHGQETTSTHHAEFNDLQQIAAQCATPHKTLLGDTGLEPVTSRV